MQIKDVNLKLSGAEILPTLTDILGAWGRGWEWGEGFWAGFCHEKDTDEKGPAQFVCSESPRQTRRQEEPCTGLQNPSTTVGWDLGAPGPQDRQGLGRSGRDKGLEARWGVSAVCVDTAWLGEGEP